MSMSERTRLVTLLVGFAVGSASALAQPTVVDCQWTLSRTVGFSNPRAAVVNPVDGAVYILRRDAGSDGLYRLEPDGSFTKIVSADRPAGLMVDPVDGDMFISEDYGGSIYRVEYGTTSRTTWVSGFHSGDDDPVGMVMVPSTYAGDVAAPGAVLSVDRGNSGPDEVWAWSADTAQGETRLHTDDGTLGDAVDIAANDQHIVVVDNRGSAGQLWEIADAGGTMSAVVTSETLDTPLGAAFDPQTGDLLVATRVDLFWVNYTDAVGEVLPVAVGFNSLGWACLDVQADGQSMWVADFGADAVYEFVRVDECAADFNSDCAVNTQDVLAFLNAWAASDDSADFNQDGAVNTLDVLGFLNAWTAGC